MKKVFLVIAIIVMLPMFCFMIYWKGIMDGQRIVWNTELKVCTANLYKVEYDQTNACSELKDFIKGRWYYLANSVPAKLKPSKDVGPISTNASFLIVGKGPTSAQVEYEAFMNNSKLNH